MQDPVATAKDASFTSLEETVVRCHRNDNTTTQQGREQEEDQENDDGKKYAETTFMTAEADEEFPEFTDDCFRPSLRSNNEIKKKCSCTKREVELVNIVVHL